jgi:hypothetical protein
MTNSQSVSMSWYRAPLWDLRRDIISYRNVVVWNLRSCIYWAPSLIRGRVCNLQCNHSIVRVAQNPKQYFTVSSETPNLEGQFPVFLSPGTGWPSYTPGHWVPLRRLLRLTPYDSQGYGGGNLTLPLPGGTGIGIGIGIRWPSPKSSQCQSQKSKSRYDRRPVNQYVLVPSPPGIKGVSSEKFQLDIRRCTLRRNFWS